MRASKTASGKRIEQRPNHRSEVTLPSGTEDWQRHLLTYPQTSGGFLISVAPQAAPDILKTVVAAGYPAARVIGQAKAGPAGIEVVD